MSTLRATVERFVALFNANDLDAVMRFFAPAALYVPPDGTLHRGHDAVRAAFAPQFAGRYGLMRFDVDDIAIDEAARIVTLRWACRHDVTSTVPLLERLAIRARYGTAVEWRGVDVLHFDAEERIVEKHTYAKTPRPLLRSPA